MVKVGVAVLVKVGVGLGVRVKLGVIVGVLKETCMSASSCARLKDGGWIMAMLL
jgi:hypothetical protein